MIDMFPSAFTPPPPRNCSWCSQVTHGMAQLCAGCTSAFLFIKNVMEHTDILNSKDYHDEVSSAMANLLERGKYKK
jgi:hypothetical protein